MKSFVFSVWYEPLLVILEGNFELQKVREKVSTDSLTFYQFGIMAKNVGHIL